MNAEHSDTILRDFPELFKRPSFDLRSGLMAFGFECGDGWFDLVYGLCRDLAAIYRELDPEAQDAFYVTQVKEKYGTLRFYVSGTFLRPGEVPELRPAGRWDKPWMGDGMEALIDAAEHASASVCEECGAPGRVRQGGWVTTRCDAHADGREPYEDGSGS